MEIVDNLPDGDDGEHPDAVVLLQLRQGGLLPGALLHAVHGDEQGGDLHVRDIPEQGDGLPDGGAGSDHVLHDGDTVPVL